MSALALVSSAVGRLLRDRTSLFFVVILPIVVIVLVGSSMSGDQGFRIGVVAADDSAEAGRIVGALDASEPLELHQLDSESAARTALRRGELDAVVVVPTDADDALESGRQVEVAVIGQQVDDRQRAADAAVGAALTRHDGVVTATRVRQQLTGGSLDDEFGAVASVAEEQPPVEVRREVVDGSSSYLPTGFSYSAPTMLVLFVFITAVAGSATVIENRRLGIHDRALAGPLSPLGLAFGEAMSLLAILALQAALIVGVGALAFGVSWGDPVAAGALIGLWLAVGTAAGVLAGAIFRTSEQASSIGVTVAIVAGMLGGCMWPLEIVPDVVQRIGHVVPHAWAVDAWIELLSRGGSFADIALELAVLATFALGLLLLAAWRLRARLAS